MSYSKTFIILVGISCVAIIGYRLLEKIDEECRTVHGMDWSVTAKTREEAEKEAKEIWNRDLAFQRAHKVQ
jgi:hypothetical protein